MYGVSKNKVTHMKNLDFTFGTRSGVTWPPTPLGCNDDD